MASRTVTSPLDVVKIMAQIGAKETREGFLKSFRNIYSNEGIRGFWKGNAIACLRLFPYNATMFASYAKLKVWLCDPSTGSLSPFNSLLAGSLAGVFATVATYPLDMVKTRLTADHSDKSRSKYQNISHAFRTIYIEEGKLAFYKGMSTSILGVIPFAGCTFMAYEFLDQAWGKPKRDMTVLENFINGCLAAAFAQTFSYPFDTIRKKLQAQSRTVKDHMKPDVEFEGMIDAFRQTVRKNGFFGLWRGTTANLAKVVPYAGAMFAFYETSKRFFLWWNGYSSSPIRDVPIPGVDQAMNPKQLRAWYQELADRGIDPRRGIPAPPSLQQQQETAQKTAAAAAAAAASASTSTSSTGPTPNGSPRVSRGT